MLGGLQRPFCLQRTRTTIVPCPSFSASCTHCSSFWVSEGGLCVPTEVVLSSGRVFPSLLRSRRFVCTGFDRSTKYLLTCIHPRAGAAEPGAAGQGETPCAGRLCPVVPPPVSLQQRGAVHAGCAAQGCSGDVLSSWAVPSGQWHGAKGRRRTVGTLPLPLGFWARRDWQGSAIQHPGIGLWGEGSAINPELRWSRGHVWWPSQTLGCLKTSYGAVLGSPESISPGCL